MPKICSVGCLQKDEAKTEKTVKTSLTTFLFVLRCDVTLHTRLELRKDGLPQCARKWKESNNIYSYLLGIVKNR